MKGKKVFKFRRVLSVLIIISFVLGDLLPMKEVFALNKKSLENLGGLNHYNSVVFGDHTATKADTEGAIAVQGNFIVNEAFSVPAAATGASNIMGSPYIENNSPSVLIGKDYISNGKLDVLANTIVVSNEEARDKLSKIQSHTKPGEYVECKIKPIREINDTFDYMRGIVDNVSNQSKGYKSDMVDDNTKVDLYIPGNISQDGYIGEKDGKWGFGRDINNKDIFISSGLADGKDSVIINEARIPEVDNNDFVVAYSDAKTVKLTTCGIEYLGQGIESGDVHYGVVDTGKPGNKTLEMLAKKVIWVFPNATKVEVAGKGIVGNLIAPNAFVDTKGGSVNGQLIAGSLNQFGGFECHNFFFNWDRFLKLAKGSVEFKKVDEEGNPLEGAEFGLFKKDNDILIEKAVSGKDGKISFTNIDPGKYYVKEIKAPDGYELSDETYNVVIEEGKATQIDLKEISNKEIKGSAVLYKVNDQSNPLEGAKFGVYKESGEKVSEATSDKDGKVLVTNLDAGKYYIQEISAPDGYEVDTKTKYEFEIIKGIKEPVVIQREAVVNVFKGGAAMLLKVHDGNEALEGAEFGLYKEDGDELIKTVKSRKDGVIKVDGLTAGKYYFKELKAPEGYKLDENKYSFEVKIGVTAVIDSGTSVNTFNNGSVKFKKVDTSGNALEGASFELYKDINGTWEKQSEVYTSNSDGIVEVRGLEAGKYYFKEIEAPSGYLLSNKEHHFEIVRGVNTTVDIGNIENVFINGSANLMKVDEEGNPLEGAEFSLYKKVNGNWEKQEGRYTSNKDGIVKIEGLVVGEYYLQEIKAPIGYELSSDKYEFKVELGNITTINVGEAKNNFVRSMVKLKKVDSESKVTLAGAIFKLTNLDTNEVIRDVVETGLDGVLEVSELKPGNYRFEEIKAPNGYIQTIVPIDFEVKKGEESQTIELIAENSFLKLANVQFTKVDYENGNPLEGAEFKLYKEVNGNFIELDKVYTSNSMGVVIANELDGGKYYFKETKAPNGYLLNDRIIEFEVKHTEGEIILLDNFKNKAEKGSFILEKQGENSEPLQGAIFELYKEVNGEWIKEEAAYTSNKEGKVVIKGLLIGNYKLKEVKAPNGYELSNKEILFTIESGKTDIPVQDVFKNVLKRYSIQLEKIDADSRELLNGAEFELRNLDGNIIDKGVVSNGTLKFDGLLPGHYEIHETKAPEGYNKLDDPIKVTIDLENSEATINKTVGNYKIKGEVLLTKKDDVTGDYLEGAKFNIYKEDGTLIKENQITNKAGELVVKDLEIGKYYIEEVEAPIGYDKLDSKINFEITKDITKIEIKDIINKRLESGSVQLKKVDSHNKSGLRGAKFKLYRKDDSKFIDEFTSNKDGIIKVDGLTFGDYYFVESASPEGYELNNEKIEFRIEKGETKTLNLGNIENEIKKGSVTLIKEDSDTKEVLKGAEFELYEKDTGVKIGGLYKTDSNGEIKVLSLRPGKYYFKEVKAPLGYEISNKEIDFEIVAGNIVEDVIITVSNDIIKGNVKLIKKDGKNSHLLEGAKFSLYDFENNYIGTYVTNENGEINVNNLRPGDYKFIENEAPIGYELSTKEYTFTIQLGKTETVVLEAYNEKLAIGKVELKKVDNITSVGLQGAEFALYKIDGDTNVFVGNYISDEYGILKVSDLEFGKYYFIETKAPEGYELNSTPIEFEINSDYINKIKELEFKNVKIKIPDPEVIFGEVALRKYDNDSKELLVGAVFELLDSNKELISSHTTNKNGEIRVNNLEPGTYYFKEVKAPEGYELDDILHKFTIQGNEQGEDLVLKVDNKKIEKPLELGSVILRKIDSKTGKSLSGAKFELKDDEGRLVGTYDVNDDGILSLSGLAIGKYSLHEIKAPSGYIQSIKPLQFEIAEGQTSSPLELVFENCKIPQEPEFPEIPEIPEIPGGDKSGVSEKDKIPATGRTGASSVVGIFSLLVGIALIFGKKRL